MHRNTLSKVNFDSQFNCLKPSETGKTKKCQLHNGEDEIKQECIICWQTRDDLIKHYRLSMKVKGQNKQK